MKKFQLISLMFAVCALAVFSSCNSDDDPTPEPLVEGTIGDGSNAYEIKTDLVLQKGTYMLKGWVYIVDGASITIPAGTIIKGEKESSATLIVEPGGKIFAQGSSSEPVVFTSAQPKGSRRPGDWGGIVICGKAPNNNGVMNQQIEGGPRTKHGGNDTNDNSGVLSYVRCEFAGFPYETDKEINGITFGSVGKGTKIDHLQVSYSNDDSFEWFGGSVDCKYLVSYHTWDDDFDTDNGFSGKMQFLLSVRSPKIGDQSLSNGFESDNNSDGSTATPRTNCVFSNVTLVGPVGQASDFQNTDEYVDAGNMKPNNNSRTGRFQAAMQIRRYSQLSCFNSVAIGYPIGLLLDNEKGNTQGLATNGSLKIKNVYFAGMTLTGCDANKKWLDQLSIDGGKTMNAGQQSFSHTYFTSSGLDNQSYTSISDMKLKQPNSMAANPNWGPTSGSPLTSKTGLFTDPLLSGFENVNYIGAFKSDSDADNWTKGWTNFDPQNTNY
ncbi:MAG: hypothetical protein LBU57_08860 [Dysgonamonadaceae bacterium]|jgi:hypothetical protein|nr:hypothetical protein [Dysgonamonadaceae bacterium]